MKNLLKKYQAWSDKVEANSLAKLPPEARGDVIAINAKWALHWPRYVAIIFAVWIISAIIFRFTINSASWTEAFVLTFLVLGGTALAFFSAWFGHHKFTMTARLISILIIITTMGAFTGFIVGRLLKNDGVDLVQDIFEFAPKVLVSGLIAGAIYSGLLVLIVFARRKQLQLRNAELEREATESRLARQLADAKLKLMQAQVEPHFLFNTLASVQHLAEPQSPQAANLTRELITFLRAGLGGLRDETTTLKREFEMAAAYLAIMQTRMGKRLTVTLDLPDEIANHSVPPAMLISLVENAIKHGVEPATDGGSVQVIAQKIDDTIHFGVRDTGMGLTNTESTDGGVGLANVRERLHAIFGDDARLTIEECQPRGVSAMIAIKEKGTT